MQDDKKRLQIRDESLSPEEQQAVEVRIDKMMKVEEPAQTIPAPAESPVEFTAVTASSAPDLPEAASEPEVPADEPSEPAPEPELTPAPPATDEIAQLAAEEAAEEDAHTPAVSESTPESEGKLAAEEKNAEQAALDAEIAAAFLHDPQPEGEGSRLKRWLAAWWHNRKARWATIIILILLLLAAAILPQSRAWALNLAGLRATASVTVLDASTELPLKNVTVRIGNAQALTNAQGTAALSKVKLGNQSLIVHRVAFADSSHRVAITIGANNLGQVSLKAVGAQYKFQVIDYVTGQPISSAQAASGDATAVADSKGLITLTAADPGSDSLSVSVSASNYRTETVTVPVGTTTTTLVQLVLSRHDVYVSKQSGSYDVYKADLDGKNAQVILKATGNETSTIALIPHPTDEEAALVDTRDGTHDNEGYLLQTLTLLDVTTGAPTVIDHSEHIQLLDWFGDRLVYVTTKAGASAADPSRYQLLSYDYKTNQRLQLDHANAFNDLVSADGSIFYATSNGYNGGISQFIRINADGTNKQVLLSTEVWNIFRKDYSNFVLANGESYYNYQIGDAKPTPTTTSFDGSNDRLYITSPDAKHSLWVDNRDGKGVLLAYDTKAQKDTTLASLPGLSYPVSWVSNDTVIFRVKTSRETADYVIGLGTNTAKKISDVSDTTGRSLWYFY